MKAIFRWLTVCCLLSGLLGQYAPASAMLPMYSEREVVFSGTDFRPANSEQTYNSAFNRIYPYNLPAGKSVFSMPLILPRGAEVEEFTIYFMDNSVDGYLTLELHKVDPVANTSQTVITILTDTIQPSGQINWKKTTLPSAHIIDSACAYQLRVIFDKADSKEIFYGARVHYQVPAFQFPPDGDTTFTVAGMNFLPGRSDMQYQSVGFGLNLTQMPPSGGASFFFPIDLLMNAQVKGVTFYYIDRGAANMLITVEGINPKVWGGYSYDFYNTSAGSPGIDIQTKVLDHTLVPIHTGQLRYELSFLPLAASPDLILVAARVTYAGGDTSRGVKIKTYAGVELQPDGSGTAFTSSNGALQPVGSGWWDCFTTNLNLPDYRSISKITFYYKDNSAADDVTMTVLMYEPPTGSTMYDNPFEWDTGSQGAPSPDIRQISGPAGKLGILDTSTHTYHAWVTFDGDADLMLYGMQVEYFYPYPVHLPVAIR